MYLVLTADTKPTTGVITNAICINTQTGVISYYNGSVWTDVAGGGGGGEANLAANVGTGTGTIFRDKTSVTLNLKTIKAGTGVTITNNTNDITLDATGAGGGEVNTYSTLGTGAAWTLTKSGVNLPFRSLIAGSSKLSLTTNTNDLTLDVAQTNLAIAWSQLTSVPSTFAPTAHKTAHVSGGGDAFAKTDVLAAPSRYIESRADPASDSGTIWIPPTSSDIEYWDTQSTPVKQTVTTLATPQTLTGKTIEAASNTFKDVNLLPTIRKMGYTIPTGTTAGLSHVGLCESTIDVGTVTNTWNTTEGAVSQFATGTTANSNAGQINPATGIGAGRRSTLANLRFKTRLAISSTTSSRVYAGFTSLITLPKSDTPLGTADSGVLVGFRTTDTNWSVFRNTGGGSAMTVTNLGIAKDTNFHTIEIVYNGTSSVDVIFDGTTTTNFTTTLPATSVNQFYNAVGQNSTTTSRTLTFCYMVVEGF
jgi:hypothetical protein